MPDLQLWQHYPRLMEWVPQVWRCLWLLSLDFRDLFWSSGTAPAVWGGVCHCPLHGHLTWKEGWSQRSPTILWFCDLFWFSFSVQERSFSGCKRGFETQGDFRFWPVNPWNWVEEQSPNLAPFSQTQLWLSLTTELLPKAVRQPGWNPCLAIEQNL